MSLCLARSTNGHRISARQLCARFSQGWPGSNHRVRDQWRRRSGRRGSGATARLLGRLSKARCVGANGAPFAAVRVARAVRSRAGSKRSRSDCQRLGARAPRCRANGHERSLQRRSALAHRRGQRSRNTAARPTSRAVGRARRRGGLSPPLRPCCRGPETTATVFADRRSMRT
jgi:hypothetical protein